MKRVLKAGVAAAALVVGASAMAAPVPREAPISGRIVAAKSGETAVLVPETQRRPAEVRQDLKAGDVLRTHAAGTLAIVFADGTQVRLGRNTALLVKAVRAGSPSALQLQRGSMWARSPRGRSNLTVETPSASAAIRGTAWSLNVSDEQTTLQVFEGEIGFFNAEGSLAVGEGEAALARPGQAPSRIFIVNPDEQRQMLHYIPAANALRYLTPYPGSSAEARAERARVLALPAEARTAEDWLVLAEAGAELDSPADRAEALARARALGPSPEQGSRADLVEAALAAEAGDWARARTFYLAARPGLSGHRRAIAEYGLRLATPEAGGAGQTSGGRARPAAATVGEAFLAAYRGDLDRALAVAAEGERRHPNAAQFAVLTGNIALLVGDETLLAAAVERGRAIDPDNPALLMLSAQLNADYRGDLDGALADAKRATELAPGNSLAWNILGLVHARRNADTRADRAYRRGIAVNPRDPAVRANRAITLLDQNRVEAARAEIEAALALDPSQSVARAFLGRYHMQAGDEARALEELHAAAAAHPNYSQAALLLAQLHHRTGDPDLADQQLDLADRYDPASPFPPLFRAILALDRDDPAAAIASAWEAVRRQDARPGSSDDPAATLPSRYLANGLRALGLGDWARFHADEVFDPFHAGAHFDRARTARPQPYLVEPGQAAVGEFDNEPTDPFSDLFSDIPVNALPGAETVDPAVVPFDAQRGADDRQLSNVLQGLALDPLSVAGSRRELRLFHEPFLEADAAASLVALNGALGGSRSIGVQGMTNGPLPVAFAVRGRHGRFEGAIGDNNDRESEGLQVSLGLELSPSDNLAFIATTDRLFREVSGTRDAPRRAGFTTSDADLLIGLYSRQLGRRALLTLGGGVGTTHSRADRADRVADSFFGTFRIRTELDNRVRTRFATGSLAIGFDPAVVTLGAEYLHRANRSRVVETYLVEDFSFDETRVERRERSRYFIGIRSDTATGWTGEAAFALIDRDIGLEHEAAAGVAYRPSNDEAFRVAYIEEVNSAAPFTLSSTASVGLVPNAAPAAINDRARTWAARWERAWTPRVFTAVEYQHQRHEGLVAPSPDTFNVIFPFGFGPRGTETVFVGSGSTDRLSVTANLLPSDAVGIDAVYAVTDNDAQFFLPRHYARVESRWDGPRGWSGTLAAGYIGTRAAFLADQGAVATLDDYLSLDAGARWESPDKAFEARLDLYNLLGADVEVYPGLPKFGRTLVASFVGRF